MIFAKKEYNNDTMERCIVVTCDCGCEEQISVKRIDNYNEYYLTLSSGKFYSGQQGLFKTLLQRLKHIWLIARGKDYRLCEIVLNEDQVMQLSKQLKSIVVDVSKTHQN